MSRSIDDDSVPDDDELARLRIETFELNASDPRRLENGLHYDPDAGSHVPVAGRLVWVTPGGTIRELDPSQLRPGRSSEEATESDGEDVDRQSTADVDRRSTADVDRSCPRCGERVSVETLVREHVDCGYVGFDGFVRAEDGGRLACPKCETEDDTGEVFSVVATVHSCIRCGQTLDRPLGRTDHGR